MRAAWGNAGSQFDEDAQPLVNRGRGSIELDWILDKS